MLSLPSIFSGYPNMRTKLSQFSFELPEKLIAKYPSKERDESKMLVVHRDTGLMEK
jgi:S-adenosylmethionine:tRNA ribosyltransferase-isomerase